MEEIKFRNTNLDNMIYNTADVEELEDLYDNLDNPKSKI